MTRGATSARRPSVTGTAAMISTLLLGTALPTTAHAGNDDAVLLGNTAAMTGGAVAATVGDGSGVWYNPAGIAAASRNAVDVNGNAFVLQVRDQPGLISLTSGERADGTDVQILSIPSALTGVRRLDDGVNIAFGIFVPVQRRRGFNAHLEHLEAGLGSRLDLGIQEDAQRYHAGGAIGFRVDENFRLGASAFVRYSTDSYSGQLSAFYEGSDRFEQQQISGRESLTSIGLEVGAGMQWTPIDELAIGLSLRSPALEFAWNYVVSAVETDVILGSTDPAFPDGSSYSADVDDVWEFGGEIGSPMRVTLGVALTLDRFWVSAEFDIQHPLDNGQLGIQRELVWNARVGARYEVDDAIGIGFGLFTDNSPFAGVEFLGDEQMDFYGGTFGVEIQTPHQLGEREDAQTLVFSTTIALRYAVGVGQAAGLSLDPRTGQFSEIDPVLGSTQHEASLHLGSALLF